MDQIHIIAEIGINHNGSLDIAKKLIDIAVFSGCDYVKFQKRVPEICVPDSQKSKLTQTPWGQMTYLEYKTRIEFGKSQYDEIDKYCKQKNIKWFASGWDKPSIDFLKNYGDTVKIASACITDIDLIKYARGNSNFLMISTGMSTEAEIDLAVKENPDLIFHTNSSYPSPVNDLNLGYITWLKNKYPNKIIGYSGHEFGLVTTWGAVLMGATYLERHITLNRSMWGSDQMASVEPTGLIKLTKGVRDLELAISKGNAPRVLFDSEKEKLKSLRK